MEIVIASGKGGVGKSTITASLIEFLSEKKIGAIDADAEAPNLHLILGVNRWDTEEEFSSANTAAITDKCINCGACVNSCIYEAIYVRNGAYGIKDYLCEGCGACKAVCPVKGAIEISDAISGWIRTAKSPFGPLVSAELDVGRPNSGKLVAEEKNIARRWVKKGIIKHLIIDSAAGIGCQVIASVSGSNLVVLIAEPTESSLSDLKRIYSLAYHFNIKSKIIINKYNINPLFNSIDEFAKENDLEIIGRIPYDRSIPHSLVAMKTILDYAPGSEAAKEIRRIAEVIGEWL